MNRQKCIEKIANKAKIKNSRRIAKCRKTTIAICRNLTKICLIEIACRNLRKSPKIAKVTRHFIATKKKQKKKLS